MPQFLQILRNSISLAQESGSLKKFDAVLKPCLHSIEDIEFKSTMDINTIYIPMGKAFVRSIFDKN